MGLSLFVRKNSKLHSLLPKHNFDKDLFMKKCDFCKLGKEIAKPDLLDNTSTLYEFTGKWCNRGERKGLCYFTYFGSSGSWLYDFTHFIGYNIEKEDHEFDETEELLYKLLKIPRKKVKEIAKNNDDALFGFDYLIKWLKLLVKYKVGFAASY